MIENKLLISSTLMLSLILGACSANKEDIEETPKQETVSNEIKREISVENEESNLETEKEGEKSTKTNKNRNLKIGETYNKEGVEITLHDVRYENGGEYDESENGKFIVANISVLNNSDEEINISSILNFELKDDQNYSHAPTILLEGVKSSLDGAVDSREILRGEIVYDVPPSEYYEIHYSEVFKKGKGKWKFPEIDIKEKK